MVDNAVGGAIGEKTAEEIVELHEMLGADFQQKSARGKKGVVNEVQMNNDMATQLIVLTRQVALLNSRAQSNNEVSGSCGVFGHGASMCPQNFYEQEQVNFMNIDQLR